MSPDYERILAEQQVVPLVDAGTVDEVWLFGGPYFGGWQVDRLNHDWARFAANQSQSGSAGVGTCHWPPNAEREYDFDNRRVVLSNAPYWRDYPSGADVQESVSRETWGGPDYARRYFNWWFAHLPRAAGQAANGHEQNWWKYVFR